MLHFFDVAVLSGCTAAEMGRTNTVKVSAVNCTSKYTGRLRNTCFGLVRACYSPGCGLNDKNNYSNDYRNLYSTKLLGSITSNILIYYIKLNHKKKQNRSEIFYRWRDGTVIRSPQSMRLQHISVNGIVLILKVACTCCRSLLLSVHKLIAEIAK